MTPFCLQPRGRTKFLVCVGYFPWFLVAIPLGSGQGEPTNLAIPLLKTDPTTGSPPPRSPRAQYGLSTNTGALRKPKGALEMVSQA